MQREKGLLEDRGQAIPFESIEIDPAVGFKCVLCSQKCSMDRIMPTATPQNVHILIYETCEYVAFIAKRTLSMGLNQDPWNAKMTPDYLAESNVSTQSL